MFTLPNMNIVASVSSTFGAVSNVTGLAEAVSGIALDAAVRYRIEAAQLAAETEATRIKVVTAKANQINADLLAQYNLA